jgi:hypothetical protein
MGVRIQGMGKPQVEHLYVDSETIKKSAVEIFTGREWSMQ